LFKRKCAEGEGGCPQGVKRAYSVAPIRLLHIEGLNTILLKKTQFVLIFTENVHYYCAKLSGLVGWRGQWGVFPFLDNLPWRKTRSEIV
jgi:hypothetical protein